MIRGRLTRHRALGLEPSKRSALQTRRLAVIDVLANHVLEIGIRLQTQTWGTQGFGTLRPIGDDARNAFIALKFHMGSHCRPSHRFLGVKHLLHRDIQGGQIHGAATLEFFGAGFKNRNQTAHRHARRRNWVRHRSVYGANRFFTR